MKPELNKIELKKRLAKKQMQEQIEENDSKKFIALHLLWLILVIFFIFSWAIYVVYLQDLPSIKTLGESVLPESTVIYDRNWNELYNLYSKEKRTYIDYSQISPMMKDAIVSTEDKTFFKNSGFDFKWLIRAGLNYVIWKSDKIQGTSTISQQLIKVSFLTSERSIKRKIQELYLSYKLNSSYTKEKILEMYLNKISFWSNAYWIEEASKTYFWKNAKEIGVLESSILASIPKWPTFYSPYNHRDRLMWYTYVYKEDSPKDVIKVAETENPNFYKPLTDKLKLIFMQMDIKSTNGDKFDVCKLDKKFFKKETAIWENWCMTIDASKLMELLNSIRIPYDSLAIEKPNEDLSWYIMEYNTWRKDFVLWRMLEDTKIKATEYKDSLAASIDFKFKKYVENIKYPYFVFYVKEFLEDKYWKDFWSQWWLKIYTTLDPKLQDKAEELVRKQVNINKDKYWASNAALVSIDNRNGQIISMVWWYDYFDSNKWSNVNIITSERQPWSSFKPIVYLNAIAKKPIWPDTPVFDSDTKFWKWEPDNYDRKFMWLMPLRKALDYSRNIPAIKVFFFWGWEDVIVKFANELWILSLKQWASYWWPLAIWTWELKPLELAQAYSVIASLWKRKEITPILKIEDKKWNVIDEYRKNDWEEVVSAAACYVLTKILSDPTSRPNAFWNNVLTLKDRKVAAKTWTSNKDVSKWKKKEILPWDLWTAWFTPQITTVVWAWNTDGSATKWTCDWLNCAAPIWHDYMEYAHKWLEKMDFSEPEWVIHATISKASWKLASSSTPSELRVSSVFAVKPNEYDGWYKWTQVDSLCNGVVTDETPPEAIKTIYSGISAAPLIDSFDKNWLKTIWKYSTETWSGSTLWWDMKNTPCDRPSKDTAWMSISSTLTDWWHVWIGKNPFEIRFDSNNPIIRVVISVDWEVVKTIPVKEENSWNINESVEIFSEWEHKISIRTVDKYYFDYSINYNVIAWGEPLKASSSSWSTSVNTSTGTESVLKPDKPVSETTENPPVLTMTNPAEWTKSLKIFNDQSVNIRWKVTWSADAINVYLNWNLFKILDWNSSFVIPINDSKDFEVGTYSVKIEAVNSSWKSSFKIVEVKILRR